MLRLVQEVIHVEDERETNALIQLLPLPGANIKRETLKLESKNFRQSVESVTLLSRDFVTAARALIGIVSFKGGRAQIFEESLLDGLIRRCLLKLVFDRKLQITELVLGL